MSAKKKPLDRAGQSVAAAVERDLAEIAKRDPNLAWSALAMTALALARELDERSNSATSKSMCAKSLTGALADLRAMAPLERTKDGLDDLSARRAARRTAGKAKPSRSSRA